MCGRFTVAKNQMEILNFLQAEFDIDLPEFQMFPRYNIAPSQDVLVVVKEKSKYIDEIIKWGYSSSIPSIRHKDIQMINIRMESLHTKKMFQNGINQRRCIILADGFYEWEKTDFIPIPHYIHKKNHQFFFFAGIYNYDYLNPSNSKTCAIITKPASRLLQTIHHRMPVMLDVDQAKRYLQGEDIYTIDHISDDSLTKHPVSTIVNKATTDSVKCIHEVQPNRLDL